MDVHSDTKADISRTDEMPIKVLVGSSKHAFYVHESAIRRPGTFFDTALSRAWKEGQERVVELPEEGEDTFRLYIQWLYTGNIFCKRSEEDRSYDTLARLYVLGEKLLDRKFQDNVANAMIAATHDRNPLSSNKPGVRRFPGEITVDLIYQQTPATSPMRRLMVDIYVRHGNQRVVDWLAIPEGVNHEFLINLTIALFQKRQLNGKDQKELQELDLQPGCAYHHHGKDEPCESKGK